MNNPIIVTDKTLTYYDHKLKGYIGSLFGCDMTVEWEPMIDGKNYFKLKIALKNNHGDELFSKIVDFPLEQTIVSGSYHNPTKSLILYFQDGTSTSVPIEDLIEGLASKLDLEKKANLGESYTCSSTTSIIGVPDATVRYARLNKIGGMSYKDDNTLKDAKITEVKSVGINIWDEQYEVGGFADNTGNNTSQTDRIRSKNNIPVLPSTVYYLKAAAFSYGRIFFLDSRGAFISALSTEGGYFTTPSNCSYIKFYWVITTYEGFCINVSNAEYNGKYYPYTEHTLAIPNSVQSLEGYGVGIDNTHYNYIDFDNKKFNRVVKKVDLGTLNWAKNGGGTAFYAPVSDIGSATILTDPRFNALSAHAPYVVLDSKWIVIAASNMSVSAETFKSNVSGMYMVYALATPTTEDIDISDIIGVEDGGTLIFENQYAYDVPSEITFYLNKNEIVSASQLVGDLKGTAEVAKYYEINGNVSDRTIGDTLAQLLNVSNPIKVTTETVGALATSNGQARTLGVGIIANPPVAVSDIVLDKYIEGDASYLCFWQVSAVDTGLVTLMPLSNIYVGGGSASVADRAISDGNGKNISETYETKANAKTVADEIKGTAKSAYERASVAINAAQDALNRVNRGVQSINADYTSGAGSIGTFYLRVNFVGGGSESYNITEELRGLINDVLTYDR